MVVGVQKAWSLTASSNGAADSNINFAEGQTPASVNNSARATMAALKGLMNQIAGGCTYGGSANAYTITSDAVAAISTSYANGMMFMLKANHTCSGASTLNVDGVGAVAIRTSDGGALVSGDIVSGGLYLLAYESTTPSFMIVNTIAGGSYQPLDATLTALAALAWSSGSQFPYFTAADTLSLGTVTALALTLLDDASQGAMQSTLGLVIGTNVQAYDAELAALAGLTSAADKVPYFTGSGAAAVADFTTGGRLVAATTFTDPNADRVFGWDDSAGAFIGFTLGTGLAFNATAIELDAQLVDVAGLTPTDNGVIIGNGSNFVVESGATLKTSLGLTIGVDVQAYDADLTTWAGITPGSGVGTFLATPSSANLAAAVTDETGSGALVFGTGPTFSSTVAGTAPATSKNTADAAAVMGLRIEGDRATSTENDQLYVPFYMSDSAGNQDEFGRLTMQADAVTSTAEYGKFIFSIIVNGSLATKMLMDSSRLGPNANDGLALGAAATSWADLFLASGGVINWANGNAVLTHSSGILTVSTGDLRVTTAGTNAASVVTIDGTQTLGNKTLTTPTINGGTIQSRVQTSSETTGALTSASANKTVQCSGNITLPASGMTDGDIILIDPRGTARTITRPGAHTMYINDTDSATGTSGAHNIVTAMYHGSSKWTLQGSVS